MPRKLRIQYRGALYHVMSRGDQREVVFRDDEDRKRFLATPLSLKWIAQRLQMGRWSYISNLLNARTTSTREQPALPLFQ